MVVSPLLPFEAIQGTAGPSELLQTLEAPDTRLQFVLRVYSFVYLRFGPMRTDISCELLWSSLLLHQKDLGFSFHLRALFIDLA